MLSRRRLLLSGLALGLSGRVALAQSYNNEADPFGGMGSGPDTGGELFDPALLPPAESPIDFPVPVIPDRRIKKKFRRQMVAFDGPEDPGTLVADPSPMAAPCATAWASAVPASPGRAMPRSA